MGAPQERSTGFDIPYVDFPGPGRQVVFLHANGFPPRCYDPLLKALALRHHVFAMSQRPLWPDAREPDISDWRGFSDDLRAYLRSLDLRAALAIGHSLGATAILRAALDEPSRFGAIVLLDPVLFPKHKMVLWGLARRLGLAEAIHPYIRKTLRRRRQFDDPAEAFARYRMSPVFRLLTDENLQAMVAGLLRQTGNGTYDLAFPPAWEARIYDVAIWNDWDIWKRLRDLEVPTLVVRGGATDTFSRQTADAIQKINHTIEVATLERGTHLFPMEQPQAVAKLCDEFLHTVETRPPKSTDTP